MLALIAFYLAAVALLIFAPSLALAQDVGADPLLAMLGDNVDLRLLVGLAVLAGALRQLPIPAQFAIAFPTAGGVIFGALGAYYSGAANPYEIGVAAVVTGAGATIVGRTVAMALAAATPKAP